MKTKKLNIMTKCRIIERTSVDGRKSYVIQQKHFLFRWCWFALQTFSPYHYRNWQTALYCLLPNGFY